MAFSVRNLLRGVIVLLIVVVSLESIAVASIPLRVPDLANRIMRIGSRASQPPPPERARSDASVWLRPLVITDDFSDLSPYWEQSNVTITPQQTLSLQIGQANGEAMALFLGDNTAAYAQIQDVDIGFDVTQTAGSDDANYGIRLRQYAPDSYIYVRINSRGYWSIARSTAGVQTALSDWQFTRHLATGIGASNHLRVHAAGTSVQIYINGVPITNLTDYAPASGQLTISAETTASNTLTLEVDNVQVQIAGTTFATSFAPNDATVFSTGGSYTEAGQYSMVASPGINMWQTPLPRRGSAVNDFQLRVATTIQAGDPEQLAYGIIFGDTGDFAHTMVLMSGNGVIQVQQRGPDGNVQSLIEPAYLPQLQSGVGAQNQIELLFNAGMLNIRINGTDIGDVWIKSVPKGNVGLLIVSGTSTAHVSFDDFTLRELAP